MACIEVTLTGVIGTACSTGIFVSVPPPPGSPAAGTSVITRRRFRGILTTSGGTIIALWSQPFVGGATSSSQSPGYSVAPIGEPEIVTDILPPQNCLYFNSLGSTPIAVARFTVQRWRICIPDSLCGQPFDLRFGADGLTEGVYYTDIPPGYAPGSHWAGGYSISHGYPLITINQLGPICTGAPDTGAGNCVDTPCGRCCENDRLLRVARCWGTDGNVYSVSQGTFARNAPGHGGSYPCGCSSASQPLAGGDFFATDIHDRDTGKLAGGQSVSLYTLGGMIQGTSLDGSGTTKTARLFRTRDFGREFTVMDIPGTYDFIQSIPHLGRLLVFGFRKKASGAPAGTAQLFLMVGKLQANGTYTWSGEKPVVLPAGAPEVRCGDFALSVRPDQVVELLYLASTPPCGSRLYSSRRIDLDATNEWV